MSLLAKELELFQKEYITIMDGISDGIVFVDRLGNIAYMNKAFKRKYNNGADVVQVPIYKIFPDVCYNHDGKAEKYWRRRGFHREKEVDLSGVLIEKDKVLLGCWIIVRDLGIVSENDISTKKSISTNEITNEINTDEISALGFNEKELYARDVMPVEINILDHLTDAVAILDRDGVFIYANRAFVQLMGLKTKELLGKNSSLFVKGLETCPIKEKKELKIEINVAGNDTELMDLLVYPMGIGRQLDKVIVIKAADLNRALQYKVRLLSSKLAYYQEQLEQVTSAKFKIDKIMGRSEQIKALKESIKKMSCSNCTVLLRGEEGVGKELFARVMHGEGPRKLGPFIKIRCADLIDAKEINKKTSSMSSRGSLNREIVWSSQVALADKGTLYLDEITDLSPSQQKNLLKFISTKQVELGDGQQRKLDVRVVVSTKNNIEELVKKRLFSERLYYRLDVLSFHVPPLRDRKEDVALLAEFFMELYKDKSCFGQVDMTISKEFQSIINNHDWPGNIKELKAVIETALNAADGPVLTLDTLPHYLKKMVNKKDPNCKNQKLKDILEETEKMVLVQTLNKTAGNKVKAAKLLGISRAGLYQKLEKHSLLDE